MTNWIKCSERLPIMFEFVILSVKECKSPLIGYLDKNGKFRANWHDLLLKDVTCWMPLPEPPEDE